MWEAGDQEVSILEARCHTHLQLQSSLWVDPETGETQRWGGVWRKALNSPWTGAAGRHESKLHLPFPTLREGPKSSLNQEGTASEGRYTQENKSKTIPLLSKLGTTWTLLTNVLAVPAAWPSRQFSIAAAAPTSYCVWQQAGLFMAHRLHLWNEFDHSLVVVLKNRFNITKTQYIYFHAIVLL